MIFGAGGDLTERLLMPALYNLTGAGLLDERFEVVGVDHAPSDDERWRHDLSATIKSFAQDPTAEFHAALDDAVRGRVTQRLTYVQADFEADESYGELARRLAGNVVFYLAVSARFFGPIVEHLGRAGLLRRSAGSAAPRSIRP